MLPLLILSSFLTPAPLPPEIEDEQALGVNKLPYHSNLMPYGSVSEALRADRSRSSFARSLDGTWKFHWVKRPEERPVDFYKPGYDASKWDMIKVPSCWQVLGYGTPYYRNNGYTFQRDWPRVTSEPPRDFTAYDERDPVGSYLRTFEVPANWNGRETFIRFDGVDAGFYLWINGHKVGYSQNSRNTAEFDITKFIHAGKNDIAVEVYRYTAGTYFEDQDMWRLSGIYRSVTLWSAPKVHIQDTFLTTDLDSAYKNATLKLVAKVHNYGTAASKPRKLVVSLYDPAGKPVSNLKGVVSVPAVAAGEEKPVSVSFNVPNPHKWSAETPTLYTSVVSLTKPSGETEELLSHRTGFRKVEIKGRVFMVNGKAVKLKGANRHEMSPETGHTVTEADMIQDLVMLKRANCNHVRTCHYSDDPRWYELCDEWGIYLVAEANAESHGYYGVLDHEPRFERMVVDRNVANVENLKNHPSIVIWSLGNECGGGSNFRSALKAVQALDSTRPTHYEPFGEGENNPAAIDSHMYTDPAGLERIAKSETLTKPMYLCEYAHAMNNSMGSIGDYNDLFDKYPTLMGGAVWEWEDQGLWNRRDPKHPILAYGGGFGEVPNDGYFIHKGVVFSDRSPKPHFPEMKRAYQWISFSDLGGDKINIRNRFTFTDLSKFAFKWTIISDSGAVATGPIPEFSLAPGESKTIQLSLPKFKVKPGTSLYLNLAATLKNDEKWAPKGWELANAQFPIYVGSSESEETPKGELNAEQLPSGDVKVAGNGFAVAFDHASGTISELSRGGRNLLLPDGGPKLHLWRAQHRNDDQWVAGAWQAADLKHLHSEVLNLSLKKGENGEAIVSSSIRYVGKNGFSALHLARYTIYADGTVAVDNGVSPAGPKIALARVGVRMLLDPSLSAVDYFARGPMENYSDRKRGSDIGHYVSTVKELFTPYEKPMECGNHEDLKWLALADKSGMSLTAMADGAPLQFSAIPYRDEEMEDVQYRIDLPKSTATVLVLSGKTLGVGSAGCGPRPLPQYQIDTTPSSFSYVLRLGGSPLAGVPKREAGPVLVTQAPNGKIALNGDGQIQTSLDGNQWTGYQGAFTVNAETKMWVKTPGFTGVVAVEPPPAKLSWKATAGDYEPGEGDPSHVLDNDASTFWHSRYRPTPQGPPHTLVVDMGHPTTIGRILLTPRQDSGNGRIRGYVIETSNDGSTWEPAKKGELPRWGESHTVRLNSERTVRYVRLTVLSDWSNEGWATLAEFDATK